MKNLLLLLSLFLGSITVFSQQFNYDPLEITGGLLQMANAADPAAEKSFYFDSNKNEVVTTKSNSDISVKVSTKKDTVYIRSFHKASNETAFDYDLLKKGAKLTIMNVQYKNENKTLILSGQSLHAGKGVMVIRDGLFSIELKLYRDGKKQDDFYMLTGTSNNELSVTSLYKERITYGRLYPNGDVLIPAIYTSFKREGTAAYMVADINDKIGLIDLKGNEIIPTKYDGIKKLNDNLYEVNIKTVSTDPNEGTNWVYGLHDMKGNMLYPPSSPYIKFDEAGLAAIVGQNGKYGYINESGKEVLPFVYKKARHFSEGLAMVQNDAGLYGFIDKTGKLVIPYKFYGASDFYEGTAMVTESPKLKKYHKIDKSGNTVK